MCLEFPPFFWWKWLMKQNNVENPDSLLSFPLQLSPSLWSALRGSSLTCWLCSLRTEKYLKTELISWIKGSIKSIPFLLHSTRFPFSIHNFFFGLVDQLKIFIAYVSPTEISYVFVSTSLRWNTWGEFWIQNKILLLWDSRVLLLLLHLRVWRKKTNRWDCGDVGGV